MATAKPEIQKNAHRTAWHSSKTRFTHFEEQSKNTGVHFGTIRQALARNSSQDTIFYEARLFATALIRMRDRGGWSKTLITPSMRERSDGIIYLNRYEDFPPYNTLSHKQKQADTESLTDAAFRKLFPHARDSIIIFMPEHTTIIRTLSLDEARLLAASDPDA